MNIIYTLLILGVLVTVHEFGHFIVAKKCGIGVIEFSIGMGPRIFSFDRNGTKYSLKLIPFGGSCAMVGEDEDNDAEDAFNNKSPWARFAVIFAGPAFNFVLAFVFAVAVLVMVGVNPAKVYSVYEGYGADKAGIQNGDIIKSIDGEKITLGKDIALYLAVNELPDEVAVTFERDGETHTVSYDTTYERYQMGINYSANTNRAELSISQGTPAETAGLKDGDIVVSVNGTEIADGKELSNYFDTNPSDGSPIEFIIERDGERLQYTLTPVLTESRTIGFSAAYYREKAGVFTVVRNALSEVRYSIENVILSLKMLVTGTARISDVSGPIGMVSLVGTVVEQNSSGGAFYIIASLLNLTVLLSANLGVMNLLPIPALDGGRLVFIIIELIRRKPISKEKEGMVHGVGFVILLLLMVVIMFNDIFKLIH